MTATAMALSAQGLSVRLGERQVLSGLDVQIPVGQWTCVVGPNGAGKSTLLKALAGLLPFQGSVHWQGVALGSIARRQRAQTLAWFGQSEAAMQDLRVHDVVMLGRLPHLAWLQAPGPADHAAVQWALQAMQGWDWRDRALGALSGGERQRVLLARALATHAPILLMDEPLNNLDPTHQVDWLELVQQLRGQGSTVLSVLHEIGMALHADHLLVLQAGRLVHQGPAGDARTHRALEAVFEHRIRVCSVDGQWAVLPRTQA
jgi:iron complex transport system ATP-binding protein